MSTNLQRAQMRRESQQLYPVNAKLLIKSTTPASKQKGFLFKLIFQNEKRTSHKYPLENDQLKPLKQQMLQQRWNLFRHVL